ncbi:hypothetical protein [Bosea sp. RAC05]|uniref:hypothetical protein n=1 Tax=Bosea sp. RAC05 TaxID=1842539 RepID=UPI000855EE83|nr:hypothetical protein [Bosea sp. RAC05]AOG02834.1 hypothetical protein BSY19_4807 [Bosea sp. RAC05]
MIEAGNPNAFDEALEVSASDLVRFEASRSQAASVLSTMPRRDAEKAVIDTILGKRSVSGTAGSKSLWLLDDAFLSYTSADGEAAMADIAMDLASRFELLDPGTSLSVFFARDAHGQPNRLLIIEARAAMRDIFENSKALLKARIYASAMAEHITTVREVSYYSIADIGDEFHADLKRTGFNAIFSRQEPVLYRDFLVGKSDDVPLHFFILAPAALLTMIQARLAR